MFRKQGFWGITAVLVAVAAAPAVGEPRRPADDAEVLERLPRVLFAAGDRLAEWRTKLRANPLDLEAALGLAQASMAIAGREDDPRFLGHARAALSPWWTQSTPPLPVRRLRAKLLERDHDYAGALADQRAVLAELPDDAQAWLEVANLSYVTGNYATSREAVGALERLGAEVALRTARMPLDISTGRAESALEDANALLAHPESPDSVLGFADSVGADAARALGRFEEAEQRFRAGLQRDPSNAYLLRAYTDFLLDRGRFSEAAALAAVRPGDTGLLLRQALAAHRLGDADLAQELTARLGDRFREIRLRGDRPHGRFESRWQLELLGQPEAALATALENWALQKQVRDTRNVLEAALAANRPEAAAEAVAFLEAAGTRDADLEPLVLALEAQR